MRLSVMPPNYRPSVMPMNQRTGEQNRMIPILTPQQIEKLNNLKRNMVSQDHHQRKSIRPNTTFDLKANQNPTKGFHQPHLTEKLQTNTSNRYNKSPQKYTKNYNNNNENNVTATTQTSKPLPSSFNTIKQNQQSEGCCAWFRKFEQQSQKPKSPFRPIKYPHWKA